MITLKSIQKNKEKARKEILKKLRSQTREEILQKSEIIKKKLFELAEFKKARCVVYFLSMDFEVDTHRMVDESIQMGKIVGVPVVVKGEKELIISRINDRTTQLEEGPYGLKQPKAEDVMPISPAEIDLVLVPGLVFDRDGNRLGRGKGYYDRFLEKLPKCARTIGLVFDFQVAEAVPVLPHDIPVHALLTNN